MREEQIEPFKELVWDYYHQHGRELPWRKPEIDSNFDPYKIMVSELMLQQTQVSRVIPKYQEFLEKFPTVESLAGAGLGEVLTTWSGLGYNRRAKYLHEAAKIITQNHSSALPTTLNALTMLPGIGHNTAAAILVYAHNQPVAFIETNVRSVFIHHFFPGRDDVTDKELLPLVERALDQENPREWYWALMDYGSHLKREHGNAARSSKHYVRQSPFEGSKRQIRGQAIKLLTISALTLEALKESIIDERLVEVLDDLVQDGLIIYSDKYYRLA